MGVNYNDERFLEVEEDKEAAIKESNEMYDGMISESDKFYQSQIDATQEYADTQSKLQQERTDFAIEQINQQKAQAKKEYKKEQAGAYVDWKKQSNPYGVNAEEMAANGMTNTGYSESSQIAMYTAYQNRVAKAKESFNQIVLEYDNAMTEARLQNNAALAEIAFNTMMQKLQFEMEGFQYENSLLIEKANKKTELDNTYFARTQSVLDQINTENALREQQRQFNASHALNREKFEYEKKKNEGLLGDGEPFADMTDEQIQLLYQQVGMNRSVEGQINAIQRLVDEGTITPTEGEILAEYFTN